MRKLYVTNLSEGEVNVGGVNVPLPDALAIKQNWRNAVSIGMGHALVPGNGKVVVVQTLSDVPQNPPVAVIAMELENNVIKLNGLGSYDTDGTIVGYAWSFSGTPSGSWTSGTATTAIAEFTLAAPYTGNVILTVTDNALLTGNSSESVERELTITQQPVSVIVTAPNSATFTIAASTNYGTALSYQWKLNGVNVGTDGPSYTTGATTYTGVDDTITCVVSNGIHSVTSDAATLHVLPAISVADVGWWKLNETSGTVAADSSGNNRHATVTGPSWNDGLVSNGAGAGIAVASVGVNIRTPPVSYCLWFTPVLRSNATSGLVQPFPPNVLSNDIFGLGGLGIGVNTRDDNGYNRHVIAAYFYSNDLPALIQPGVRRHYAVVGDATSSKLYIDGVLITTSSSLQSFSSSSGTLRFNYTNEDTNYQGNRFSKGTLRDVRLYKKVLTGSDIAAIFNAGPAA